MRWVLVVAVAGCAAAHADEEEPLVQHAAIARIAARLDGPIASLTVRFGMMVHGPAVEGAHATVALPALAVVTGASVIAAGQTAPLALVDADRLTEEYERLESEGPARPWVASITKRGTEDVEIELGGPRTTHAYVDVELAVPACWAEGARHIALPHDWLADSPFPRSEPDAVCGSPGEARGWVAIASRERGGSLRGGAGRLALPDRDLAKAELDLAPRLGEVPADLATALVLDASRSMTRDALAMQRRLVAAYLGAARGRVQIIAYARTARALLPRWTDAAALAPSVERTLAALEPRNGSNLEAGLREAAAWLHRIRGTHRIVVITDEQLVARLAAAPRTLLPLVPPDTRVQVVALDAIADPGLVRDDDGVLAPLAAATRGIAVRLGGRSAEPLDATVLARPIALDHLAISAPGWTPSELAATTCHDDASLAEGASCVWWGDGEPVSGPIAISGQLWGDRVVHVMRPEPGRARDLARELAAGGSLDGDLEPIIKRVAQAVSDQHALFARWGGDGGYGPTVATGYGYSSLGVSSCSDCGGMPSHLVRPPDPLDATPLEPLLRGGVAACRPGRPVELAIELTRDEVVDVAVLTAVPAGVRSCIEEAVWNTGIPATGRRHARVAL